MPISVRQDLDCLAGVGTFVGTVFVGRGEEGHRRDGKDSRSNRNEERALCSHQQPVTCCRAVCTMGLSLARPHEMYVIFGVLLFPPLSFVCCKG